MGAEIDEWLQTVGSNVMQRIADAPALMEDTRDLDDLAAGIEGAVASKGKRNKKSSGKQSSKKLI